MQTKQKLKHLRDRAVARLATEVRELAEEAKQAEELHRDIPLDRLELAVDSISKWRYIAKTLIDTYKDLS